MTTAEIQEVVKKAMGEDPIEMVIKYYRGLIQLSADVIAEEQKNIHKLEERIGELAPTHKSKDVEE